MPATTAPLLPAILGAGGIDWSLGTALLIALAGMAAGAINAVVGSGSLITFPTLVGLGLEKIPANITNNTGLVPGSFSAVHGYRRELSGQGASIRKLAPLSVAGALLGATLLLALPTSVFDGVVPFLVLLGVVLVAAAPLVQARARRRNAALDAAGVARSDRLPVWLLLGVAATGVYGGYFGAGQGVILTGVLGMGIHDDLRRVNALKNLLAAAANTTALVVFLAVRASAINWPAAAIIAVASTLGAQIGSTVGRRVPQPLLRGLIVVVGLFVSVRLLRS